MADYLMNTGGLNGSEQVNAVAVWYGSTLTTENVRTFMRSVCKSCLECSKIVKGQHINEFLLNGFITLDSKLVGDNAGDKVDVDFVLSLINESDGVSYPEAVNVGVYDIQTGVGLLNNLKEALANALRSLDMDDSILDRYIVKNAIAEIHN